MAISAFNLQHQTKKPLRFGLRTLLIVASLAGPGVLLLRKFSVEGCLVIGGICLLFGLGGCFAWCLSHLPPRFVAGGFFSTILGLAVFTIGIGYQLEQPVWPFMMLGIWLAQITGVGFLLSLSRNQM